MDRFCFIEPLESRMLLSATLVRLATNLGNIDIQLTDDVTPITVHNFLNYVNSGRYTNTIFNRNSGAVIQAGGFTSPHFANVPTDAAIVNEFQPGVTTNIRGTIGMAKTSDPNSAQNEFFINLTDNSSSFDNTLNSGGFTTFGTVTADTLATVDAIAAVPVVTKFSAPFDTFPLINYSGSGIPKPANLVIVKKASVLGVFTNTFTFGDSGIHAITYTDADGTRATLRLTGGTGTINFNGTGVFETTRAGTAIFTGTGMSISSLNITSTGAARLTVSALGGNQSIDLPATTVTGAMTSFMARGANLTGALTADDLGLVTLGSIIGGSIVDHGSALATNLNVVGSIADGSVTSAGTFTSLRAANWTDSTGSLSSLSAASVGRLNVLGTMAADLNLTGSGTVLTAARVGTLTGGTWTASGDAGNIVATTTAAAWAATFTGHVNQLSAQVLSGSFTAGSANIVHGTTISGASLNFNKTFDGVTPALNTLSAITVTGSSVRATDSILHIVTRTVDDSIFSAGINFGASSVNTLGDFVSAATIGTFNSQTFNNAAVIADVLGTINLGTTNDTAPTRPFFGVAADRITSLRLRAVATPLFLKTLDDPAAVPGLIAAQNVTLANLQVKVL